MPAEETGDVLGLEPADLASESDQGAMTFAVSVREGAAQLCERAPGLGGSVVKPPFGTYCGWHMAVLRDPEGHALRIAFPAG